MATISQRPVTPAHHNASVWPSWHENKPFALALLLVLAFLVVFLMAKTGQTLGITERLDQPVPYEHDITVDGVGTVVGVPDIATVSMSVTSKGTDVAAAQTANTSTTNALISAVEALGVSKDDMQTSDYSLYEDNVYDPDTGEVTSKGWVVSQTLTVKVRDTSKVSSVFDTAGKNGATNLSGPNFTIDDTSSLLKQARAEAIKDAAEKAAALAATLGVTLERVVGYNEYQDNGPIPYYAYDSIGGLSSKAPEVLAGTNEITLNVTVTYKLAE